jgi:hypothetical protein
MMKVGLLEGPRRKQGRRSGYHVSTLAAFSEALFRRLIRRQKRVQKSGEFSPADPLKNAFKSTY